MEKEIQREINKRDWIRETALDFAKIAYRQSDNSHGIPDIADRGVSMAVALANSIESELGKEAWD